MSDIKHRKPRIINLKKKGKKVVAPITQKVEVVEQKPVVKEWQGGTEPCVDCGTPEAQKMNRCRACDAKHKEIANRLDNAPRQSKSKPPPPIASVRKEVSQGVVVTVQTLEPLR